jgi:hypothetical protein
MKNWRPPPAVVHVLIEYTPGSVALEAHLTPKNKQSGFFVGPHSNPTCGTECRVLHKVTIDWTRIAENYERRTENYELRTKNQTVK